MLDCRVEQIHTAQGKAGYGYLARKNLDLQIPYNIWIFLNSLGIMSSSIKTVPWN
jgi:hypothetical protein